MLLTTSLLLLGASLAVASEQPSKVIDERDISPWWLPTDLPTVTRPRISAPSYSYSFGRNRYTRPCNYRSYTAIGDSYSAGLNYGYGLLPVCSANITNAPCNGGEVCLRNQESFPMYMQNKHNFTSFQFIACSGANTTECQTNQVASPQYGRPDLVTLTIAGDNNQAFLGLIVNCVYQRDPTFCSYAIANAQNTIANIDPYLNSLFQSIVSTNWNWRRRVVVAGYPKLFSTTNDTSCQSDTLSAVSMDDRQTINNLGDAINAALKKAVRRMGPSFTYADADPLYEGHRLCDDDPNPYFQYDIATAYLGVFHPTVAGQQALFSAVDQAAGCAAPSKRHP